MRENLFLLLAATYVLSQTLYMVWSYYRDKEQLVINSTLLSLHAGQYDAKVRDNITSMINEEVEDILSNNRELIENAITVSNLEMRVAIQDLENISGENCGC